MAKPITDALRLLQRGNFAAEAGDALAQLVTAVSTQNKAGKMTIEINVKPAGKKNAALIVTPKFTVRAPADAPDETLLFPTPEGNLETSDPNQVEMDLRVIKAPSATETPLKQVGV